MIAKNARKGLAWASKKVEALVETSTLTNAMPAELSVLDSKITIHLDTIAQLQNSQSAIEKQLREMVQAEDFPADARQYLELLDDMPGVGFITATTLVAENGDFRLFKSPKALVAFFGIDL